MTAAQAWVDRARSYLLTGGTAQRNLLAAPYTAGTGTLTFTYDLGGISEGQRLSIGLNEFYVWAVNPTAKTATVTGGQSGTTDVNAASGTVVWVRPKFTDYELFTAINEELGSLSAPQNGLFQVKTVDVTYNPILQGYDLTATDIQSVYLVRAQTPGPVKDWPIIPAHHVRLDRSQLVSDFPDGTALQLMDGGYQGLTVRLVYRAPYSVLSDVTADVASTGVSTQAADIPPLGAAIRLMAGREIKRNFTDAQPDTRRMAEVPPGAVANSATPLRMLRQQRIVEEASRLAAQYPYRTD